MPPRFNLPANILQMMACKRILGSHCDGFTPHLRLFAETVAQDAPLVLPFDSFIFGLPFPTVSTKTGRGLRFTYRILNSSRFLFSRYRSGIKITFTYRSVSR